MNNSYKKNKLKEYISNSEIRVFNNKIKVRLSKELAKKYDKGCYDNYLKNMKNCFEMIETLNIKYPGNANPILYVYIVPDNDYIDLLNYPEGFGNGKGGGKPVNCYDLDGFTFAYGLSQNMLENSINIENDISRFINEIHELSHLVHKQFFSSNSTICEGFAETIPLYGLGLEDIFEEHRNTLLQLNYNQILSVKELFNCERNGSYYGTNALLPNKSCSFRVTYVSSYLFVRGCIEKIVEKYNFSKSQAIQFFLEMVKASNNNFEYLIFDIANDLDVSKDELLNGKKIQIDTLNSISNAKRKMI